MNTKQAPDGMTQFLAPDIAVAIVGLGERLIEQLVELASRVAATIDALGGADKEASDRILGVLHEGLPQMTADDLAWLEKIGRSEIEPETEKVLDFLRRVSLDEVL